MTDVSLHVNRLTRSSRGTAEQVATQITRSQSRCELVLTGGSFKPALRHVLKSSSVKGFEVS